MKRTKRRRVRILSFLVGGLLLSIPLSTTVQAHCPLCTAGAGGLAAVASALGIGMAVVGVFVGAFAAAMGLWMAKYVDDEYVPHQGWIIAFVIYLSVVVPLVPLANEYTPIYVSIAGGYGTPLNRTYLVDTYLVGAILGGVVACGVPRLSAAISELRGSTVPFQGLTLTFALLGASAIVLQVVL